MIAQGSAPSLKTVAQRPSSRQIQQAQAVPVQEERLQTPQQDRAHCHALR